MSLSRANLTVAASSVLLALVTGPAGAQQAGPSDTGAPSFRDERRWTPRKPPEQAPLVPPNAKPEPPAPTPVPTAAKPPPSPVVKLSRPEAQAPTSPTEPPAGKATAPAPASVQTLAPASCGVPSTTVEPLPAGRMRVGVTSACRAGQPITWTYGGAEFSAKLDATGKLDLIVDCFAGTSTPVEMKLSDGSTVSLPVAAKDLDRVSKVAVIWRAEVDLDLHAFEFAAATGEPGHVWSGNASSFEAIHARGDKNPRGGGYLSTAMKADGAHDKIEVYTFLHRDGPSAGQVAFAVDHASRGAKPAADTCGSGPNAEVAFRLITFTRRNTLTRTSGLIAASPCDVQLEPQARFATSPLPPLKIRP